MNCYNCREFGYLARHYRNWRTIGENKRIEITKNEHSKQKRYQNLD